MATSTNNITAPEDYAILFSGGGSIKGNHTRYYDELKSLYLTLVTQRGVDPDNITILYADGEASSTLPSRNTHWYQDRAKVMDFLRGYNIPESIINDMNAWLKKLAVEPILSPQQADRLKDELSEARRFFKERQIPIEVNFKTTVDSERGLHFLTPDIFIASDLSFANQSKVLPASSEALRDVLTNRSTPSSLLNQIDDNDHLFVWTFDHGGITNSPGLEGDNLPLNYLRADGTTPTMEELSREYWADPALGNRANLTTWNGGDVKNQELSGWIAPVIQASGFTTLAYTQCFAGGMLEASRDQLASTQTHAYGMAAANAYETSKSDYFASQISKYLYDSNPTAKALFEFAKSNDKAAVQTAYPDNGGDRVPGKEHPWAFGGTNGEFKIFSGGDTQHPLEQAGIDLIDEMFGVDTQEFQQIDVRLREDSDIDLFAELRSVLGADIKIDAVSLADHGLIEENVGLIYTPVRDFYGQDSVIVRYTSMSGSSGTIQLNIEVEPVNDAPVAQDTFVSLDGDARRSVFSVDSQEGYLGDFDMDGDNPKVKYFSLPENGHLKKVGRNSFKYIPDPGFKGDDSFAYVISDGEAYSSAEVHISVDSGAFSHNASGFYQLASSDHDPIINPLRSADGSVLTDDESSRWNIIAAELDGTVYRLLLEGLGRRDGYYMVWDAGLDGTVFKQRDWVTAKQLHNKGYDTLFDRDFVV